MGRRPLRADRQPVAAGRATRRPRPAEVRRWISTATAADFIGGLAEDALVLDDPPALPGVSPDPDDDYLIALARAAQADHLVTGDRHLLDLTDPDPPVLTPHQFLELIDA